ncbi:ABC transporter ATP-binding protein [Thermoanaerobacter thermocopriae]|uniref:ABC transporter ATP-binding protein n=1 Tax=Thermoanaerobacter thermocopriae TaxID=29350 RepID=UPI00048CC8CF|nr:ATP-binding cassette domain-containing protein [Thermoanaerobacter thermocopriae]
MRVIEVKNLTKVYCAYEGKSLGRIFKRLWSREGVKEVKALDNVSFSIDLGESVGLIGVNGAGKSTTIKILTGILEPTEGVVRVFGNIPSKHRMKNNYRIGAVFGQRTQLRWDLPAYESYGLLKEIYNVDDKVFKERLDYFSEVLDIKKIMHRPVRTLSLGEKMRAELCAAFLHGPEVVFLDEPTIGLDIFSKEALLHFLKEIKEKKKVTIILTTHDLSDIEEVSDRIIILDRGKILFDASKDEVLNTLEVGSQIIFTLKNKEAVIPQSVKSLPFSISKNFLKVDNVSKDLVPQVLTDVFSYNTVLGVEINYPDFKDIVKQIYLQNKDRGRKNGDNLYKGKIGF